MDDNKDEHTSIPEAFRASLDSKMNRGKGDVEFWMARDLQVLLGYEHWRHFRELVEQAKVACETAGAESTNHIYPTVKKVPIGSGAHRDIDDYLLSRFGCYLVAMNGDPSKQQIGYAQVYFAVQTRRQELAELGDEEAKRINLRARVRDANKALNAAAKNAGVKRFGVFHDEGYRGLYGLRLAAIRDMKGLGPKDDLLDVAGRAELAANEFRITQAEEQIIKNNIRTESGANQRHREVGQQVRQAIERIGGTMPERLPIEPSIKKIEARRRRATPAIAAPVAPKAKDDDGEPS